MRIGEAALESGVSIQTLRYYERLGLVVPPMRQRSGYRRYSRDAVHRVRFIRRAQEIGFTLKEIAQLLLFWGDSTRACRRVEKQAAATLERIDVKIRDLEKMRVALAHYVTACREGTSLNECPLLAALGAAEE